MATKTRRLADLLANIDDNSKVTSAGLLDATITATDLAPDSVDSSELVDGAVDTSHIGDLQVTAGKVAANAVTSAKIADANITAAKLSSTALASVEHVKPHIQPGTLYPAWSGLLDNHTGFTFTDSSASARTLTLVGDIRHTGSTSKVGSTSISFEGTNERINVPAHADFDFGSGDFTIEYWFNTTSTARQFHFAFESDHHIGLDYSNSAAPALTRLNFWASSNGSSWNIVNADGGGNGFGTVTVNPNTWYHVAVVRNGSSWKTYIDGVQNTSVTSSAALTAYNSEDFRIGAHGGNTMPFIGHMDEFRVVKGTAVYTGAFTPPTA